MKTVIIEARPLSRFHFGKPAIDNATGLSDTADCMSSDSLFSALVNNVEKYDADKTEGFIKLFEDGKVRISSLLYCLNKDSKNIYFLPKPIDASTKLADNTPYSEIKRVKKVRFLSQSILETYGENWVTHLNELKQIGNAVLLKEESDEDLIKNVGCLYKKGLATHINTRPLPKEENREEKVLQNEIFQTAYIQMPLHKQWKTLFYFLLDDTGLNDEEQKLLNFSIELIRFEGLGGKRNVGYGWVDKLITTLEHPFVWSPQNESSNLITTGLFIPQSFEEFERLKAYDLIQRGGRMLNKTKALKTVKMVAEGAILKGCELPCGCLADITPENYIQKFVRLGSCITLPL